MLVILGVGGVALGGVRGAGGSWSDRGWRSQFTGSRRLWHVGSTEMDARGGPLQVDAAKQVTALARVLQLLLTAVDGLMELTTHRQRDFLAAWGAADQRGGEWGKDLGNVSYGAGWQLMVSLNNEKCLCCKITSLETSAQMMDALMGIACLNERES